MSFSIAGKTAIVTGAATGIGRAIARQFAEAGANVMCADMDEEGLVSEFGDEAEAEDTAIKFYAGDLREKLTIANLLSATLDAFDGMDILVNASRQVLNSDPLCSEDDGIESMLQQNLITSLRVTQAVAKKMIALAGEREDKSQIGSIINLSSIAAHRTHPSLVGFSVASAALEQMTRSMAVSLAPEGIRVNALACGSVMSTSLKTTLAEQPDLRDRIIEATPMGRIAPASELAEAAQFLASGAAGFMTGQVLTIDGGRTLTDNVASPAH
ncbi:SDR family NAD(P)-dependent oxidoreductase [Aliiroseovarius sp. PTFE2010]|uniref:SDR family NAD(P)-dependent oxidoreductase n=1 Tax=Aliiroseovarius sp. PTFE2010 TaxID=3417190 RepID=UPI003CEFC2D0